VCAKAGIPESFTRKVFQALVQGDFLEASRGPGGGYSLTRPASEITLIDVVRAVDGEDTFDHCILGFPICGGENPCPLHPVWARAKEQFLHHLGLVTLEEVSVSTGEPDQGK
jgi:Rrf2 family protein